MVGAKKERPGRIEVRLGNSQKRLMELCTLNAGAHGSDVSHIFQSAEIVLETGKWVRYSKEDMEFAYRPSVLHEQRGIVPEAAYAIRHNVRKFVSEVMRLAKIADVLPSHCRCVRRQRIPESAQRPRGPAVSSSRA